MIIVKVLIVECLKYEKKIIMIIIIINTIFYDLVFGHWTEECEFEEVRRLSLKLFLKMINSRLDKRVVLA